MLGIVMSYLPWIILGVIFLILVFSSFVNVSGGNICLLERKYFGKEMVGRTLAYRDEVGLQARTLGPSLHFLIPFIYRTKKVPFRVIGEGKVGLVRALAGETIPSGQIFAKVVECSNFQDAEAFLKGGGQKGPQVRFLPPGQYMINPYAFEVEEVEEIKIRKGEEAVITANDGKPLQGRLLAKKIDGHKNFSDGEAFLSNGGQQGPQSEILQPGTYRINSWLFNYRIVDAIVVGSKQVGLVTARDGAPLPKDELIAASIEGHNNFQDVQAFLDKGGQRGPQLDILKPGTYYINPFMFEVTYEDIQEVKRGEVAVIISNVGKEHPAIEELKDSADVTVEETANLEKRLDVGIERYVVESGFRGIQKEVAGPGVYYLNTRAFIPNVVDTTNITIDWDEGSKTDFNPLQIISKDAFEMKVSVKVIIRVRPDQAPYMIAKIGSIGNLITHVIHPMIDSSFRNQASATSAMNFMQDRHDEQSKAEERTRKELEKYHVELVSVLICQIQLPQNLMDTQTARVIAEQQLDMYKKETDAQAGRIAMEAKTAEANRQGDLVQSSINVKIAENEKKKKILDAEGEGGAIEARMTGEAKGTELLGKAKGVAAAAEGKGVAEGYEAQKVALTPEGVVAIEIAKQISNGKVKIVPDTLIQGGGDTASMFPLISATLVKGLSGTLPATKEEKTAPAAEETTEK